MFISSAAQKPALNSLTLSTSTTS